MDVVFSEWNLAEKVLGLSFDTILSNYVLLAVGHLLELEVQAHSLNPVAATGLTCDQTFSHSHLSCIIT